MERKDITFTGIHISSWSLDEINQALLDCIAIKTAWEQDGKRQ